MTGNRFILGVDPGDSTGLALLLNGKFLLAHQGPPTRMLAQLEVCLQRVKPEQGDRATVAVERFTSGRLVMTHQPTAQQVIGVVGNLAARYGAAVALQGAADARALAPDELLHRLGLYQTGTDVGQPDALDANMAIRHALLSLAREQASAFEALLRAAGQVG